MARIRTIYQSEALFAGPNGSTGQHYESGNSGASLLNQIHRVQNLSYNVNLSKRDIYQLGQLANVDRLAVDAPVVNLSFTYLQANLDNERKLGFTISSGTWVSCISGFLTKTSDERNYFVKVAPEGNDAIGYNGASSIVFGIGNAGITSYSTEGAVGDFPKSTITVEGQNLKVDITGGAIPAVNPSNGVPITAWFYGIPSGNYDAGGGTAPMNYSALLPGDINFALDFSGVGINTTDWKVQNYNISFDLARTPISKLGTKYAVSREINFPATIRLSVNAILGDYQTGNLTDLISCGANNYTATVTVNKPGCSKGVVTSPAGVAIQYRMVNASLDSVDYSLGIGDVGKTATLNFSVPLSGPQDTSNGLFMSGINSGIA